MDEPRPPLPVLDFEYIGPKKGTRFPDIQLPNQDGTLIDIHAVRGERRALVLFHRSASW